VEGEENEGEEDNMKKNFCKEFLKEMKKAADLIEVSKVESIVNELVKVRKNKGRVFMLGVGGSAASASHVVNDLRKLCSVETYAPMDNVSELTARTNDEGWDTVFAEYLRGSRLSKKDAIFILSVGGGNAEKNISPNLVKAIDFAKEVKASILGVVGKDGGYTAKSSKNVVIIPTIDPSHITPVTESFHSVICHLIVTHPKLKTMPTKWESTR